MKKLAKKLRRPGGFYSAWREIYNSPAYLDLRLVARAQLRELENIFHPQKNGRLQMATNYAAERLGVERKTVMPAFHELAAHGFIALTKGEAWQEGDARAWRLTYEPADGREPTDEWKAWVPGMIIFTTPKRSGGARQKLERGSKKRTTVVQRTDHPPIFRVLMKPPTTSNALKLLKHRKAGARPCSMRHPAAVD